VGNGSGELDVAHALAANARQRHFDAALLADDALVLHALVLAAQALVVLDRPEDAGAEQAVALGLEGTVVDGFRLLDLAIGPGQNLLRRRNRDPDGIEILRRHLRIEKIHDLLVHRLLHGLLACGNPGRRSQQKTKFKMRHITLPGTSDTGWVRDARRSGQRNPCAYSAASGSRCLFSSAWNSQLDVEAQRAHFLDENVEALRNTGFERVVAAHDRLVDLGTAGDVVRLHRQHFLQRVGRAVSFERPDFHFAEALTAELRLAAQRLLGNERVRTDRTGVDLVVDQVVSLSM
jgi:hypothetical protein